MTNNNVVLSLSSYLLFQLLLLRGTQQANTSN